MVMSGCGSTSRQQMDVQVPYEQTEENGLEEDSAEEEILARDLEGPLGKPVVGKQFTSKEEAYNFYNAYAGRVGFSVRKASQTKRKGGVSSARFTCSKEGTSQRDKKAQMPVGSSSVDKSPKRLKSGTRIGCKASCRVRLTKKGSWVVSVFEENHNHPLVTSPSKLRNLRSQRSISKEDDEIIQDLSAQGVETSKIYEYLSAKHGGKDCIRMKKKDVSNRISKENRQYVGCDAETTVLYFQKRQEQDPEFFFAIDTDDDGQVRNMFWVEGRGRRAYQEFGDVVTFDTTYNTNKYRMPFAPFIGVNHHRHSIFFGMALLRTEDATSFVWLFRTWLTAMYEKHPTAILTDQDPAMKKAIEQVFPQTVHRCCQWHVMRKAREHLGVIFGQQIGFLDELGAVINRSMSEQDFVDSWVVMTEQYGLTTNKHLKVMFEKRREWVPCFFRNTFFADMSTTQRSESMNAILKLWVSNHNSIYQFAMKVDSLIESIWQRESDEDMISMNEIPQLHTRYQIEVEGRRAYTRAVFKVFRDLVLDSTLGTVNEITKNAKYEVTITSHPMICNWVPETYMVDVDIPAELFSCSCKGFEFEGLLCSHAIKIMQHVGLTHLPSKYILKRWSKDANAVVKRPICERVTEQGESIQLTQYRFGSLKDEFAEIAKMGSKSAKSFEKMKQRIADLRQEFSDAGADLALTDMPLYMQGPKLMPCLNQNPKLRDPSEAQCKGRKKKPTRFLPPADAMVKKRRTCSYCNKQAGHNSRTCPLRDKVSCKRKIEGSEEEEDEHLEDVSESD